MDLNKEFWRGKRVVLTGHTGFKGSWLALWLHSLGAEVHGFALAPDPRASLFEQAGIAGLVKSTLGDIRDAPSLESFFAGARPEIVLHLAAQALVRPSYADPVNTWSTNVMGTLNVLEAVRKSPGVRAVVNVTTDKCYENREWVWGYRESDPLGGHDPYSSSKAASELATASWRNAFFPEHRYHSHQVALATARAGNVIGGGDYAQDRLIPDILQGYANGRSVAIRSPGATRPWQHVLDPLSGYLRLAELLFEQGPGFAQAWNFGPPGEGVQTVGWIADTLARQWGGTAAWHRDAGDHPHEAHSLTLDSSKSRRLLGWIPRLGLEQALAFTVQWHREVSNGRNARDVCLEQISRYVQVPGQPTPI